MDLLLCEQTLLIALDDEKGRDTTQWGSEAGLAGALLIDLARLQLVDVDAGGHIAATAAGDAEHELLRDALAAIREASRPRDARGWVSRLPRELRPLRTRVAQGLVRRGVLEERRSRLLGIVPLTRFPEADPAPERELRDRLRAVLLDGDAPAPDEALLVGLLDSLGLVGGLVSRDRRRDARRRAREVAEQGLAGTAVRDAVRATQAAVMTAVTVAATTTATTPPS